MKIGTKQDFKQSGFTIVELMIAMLLGLLLTAVLVTLYVNTSRVNNEMSKMNQQIENARFAFQLLREDLWHAGYWGEHMPTNTPDALPNPCSNANTWSATDKANMLALPLQSGTAMAASCSGILSDIKDNPGTIPDPDIILIRHADTCIAGATNCESDTAGKLYFQVSLCSFDTDPYVFSTTGFTTLRKKDTDGDSCTDTTNYTTTYSDKRKIISNIYYIRDYAVTDGDGIPTLMRSELDLSGGTITQMAAQPYIEGIEHLEIEYGIDDDGNGAPDRFADPTTAAEWGDVVAAKVHLLARNLEPTNGYQDTKIYRLGPTTLGPYNDRFKRHAYTEFVRLVNPSGRRE